MHSPDTDTLVLNAEGGSRMYGETVGRNLVTLTDKAGWVVGVTLEHAAQILRHTLCGESGRCETEGLQPGDDMSGSYIRSSRVVL